MGLLQTTGAVFVFEPVEITGVSLVALVIRCWQEASQKFSWPTPSVCLIFEGIPFVLLGSLISGVIAAFIPSSLITGLLPKNRLVATLY